MRRPVSTFFLLASVFPAVAGAVVPVSLEIQPAAPTTLQPVTLEVRVVNQPAFRAFADRFGNQILINLVTDCVLAACPTTDQTFELPLGFLPAGHYQGQVWVDYFLSEDFSVEVTAGQAEPFPARFSLEVAPSPATDAQRTQILVTSATCEPAAVARVERVGNAFTLWMDLADPDPLCELPAAERVLGSKQVDLGQLSSGAYTVELRHGLALLKALSFEVRPRGSSATLLGRYEASLTWRTPDGHTGAARPVALSSAESALFSFFDLGNWEVLVKVLDGCALNGHRWVFLAAATDVEFRLEIVDGQGQTPPYVYLSPAGLLTPPLADTIAIPCSP